MKIAIYTLTRDRLEYTKESVAFLRQQAGMQFDHFIVDNGSEDGTKEWLEQHSSEFSHIIYNAENLGISTASNQALNAIFESGTEYDLIIKMDNDCRVISDNILGQISEIYSYIFEREYIEKYILSPLVLGINNQPTRSRYISLAGRRIGLTAIVGGIFHIVPSGIYRDYRFPTSLPKAWGQDDHFCKTFKDKGGQVGYIEGLQVEHIDGTDGQARKFPNYFERKFKEEKRA